MCSLAKDRIKFEDKESTGIFNDYLGSGTEYDDEDFPDDHSSLFWNTDQVVENVNNTLLQKTF